MQNALLVCFLTIIFITDNTEFLHKLTAFDKTVLLYSKKHKDESGQKEGETRSCFSG